MLTRKHCSCGTGRQIFTEQYKEQGEERIKKHCINIFPDATLQAGVDFPVEIRHLEKLI